MTAPVTDAVLVDGELGESRNDSGESRAVALAHYEERIELILALARHPVAARTGRLCDRCGRTLTSDDALYLVPVRRYVFRRCASCVSESWKQACTWKLSCEGCGRTVFRVWNEKYDFRLSDGHGSYLPRQVATCSWRCAQTLYRRRHRKPKASPDCQGCGGALDARSDALYCAPACRQRAYRQRQHD